MIPSPGPPLNLVSLLYRATCRQVLHSLSYDLLLLLPLCFPGESSRKQIPVSECKQLMKAMPVNDEGGGCRVYQRKPSHNNSYLTPCEREQDWTCKVLDLTKSWSTRWGAPEQKSPIRGVPYWVTVVRPQYSCCTVIDWATWSKHGLASEVKADPEDATSGHSDNSLIVAEQVLPWREDHSLHSQLLLDSA